MELWIFDKKRGRRSILSTSGDAHPLAPLPGADSPYQGEMSRRDKRGRDAGSAKPRLRGCRRSAGKDPNRKFSLRFGKEETSTEEKRRRLRRLVPSWSFLTRLRRPYLFPCAGKDRGEKGAIRSETAITYLLNRWTHFYGVPPADQGISAERARHCW